MKLIDLLKSLVEDFLQDFKLKIMYQLVFLIFTVAISTYSGGIPLSLVLKDPSLWITSFMLGFIIYNFVNLKRDPLMVVKKSLGAIILGIMLYVLLVR